MVRDAQIEASEQRDAHSSWQAQGGGYWPEPRSPFKFNYNFQLTI